MYVPGGLTMAEQVAEVPEVKVPDEPWTVIYVEPYTVELKARDGALIWEVGETVYDKTPTGRRKWNTHRFEVKYRSPWVHIAVAWAVAQCQGEEFTEPIFKKLTGL
jgi:hypothetical protein